MGAISICHHNEKPGKVEEMKKTEGARAFEEKLSKFLIENEILKKILKGTGIEHTLNEMRERVYSAIDEMGEAGIILDESDETPEEEIFESRIRRKYKNRENIPLESLSPHLQEYYSEYTQDEFNDFISELRDLGEGARMDLSDTQTEARHISISDEFYSDVEEILNYTECSSKQKIEALRSLISEIEALAEENIQMGLELIG